MAKLATLVDDFEDNILDPLLWVPYTGLTETGGQARLTLSFTVKSVFMDAAATYDGTFSHFTAEIPTVTPAGTSGTLQSGLAVRDASNNIVGIQKFGNQLIASKTIGGVGSALSLVLYDPPNHAYWRIRADSSNVYWELGPNGYGGFWILHTENFSTLFPFVNLTPYFFAGYTGVEASPGSIRISYVNPPAFITASGSSTSSGTATLRRILAISASGSTTSSGTAAITIPPPSFHSMAASGSSTTTGQASFIILAVGQMTAVGNSLSSGSAVLILTHLKTAIGQSFATGTAAITIIPAPPSPDDIDEILYWIFEPPVVYDRPAVHSKTPRRVRSLLYYDGHSPGATGVSVLKINGTYQSIYTPTVDQMTSASEVYQGGHIYNITRAQADALSSAGYTVIPGPRLSMLYPLDTLYPDDDLYPAYYTPTYE